MKKKTDPRHIRRIQIIKDLFAASFVKDPKNSPPPTIKSITDHTHKIDPIIEESAPQFPIGKISKIDVSILRLAIYELLLEKREPQKVIIDEAIELAKEFGADKSPSFINGVLGKVVKKYLPKIEAYETR